MRRALAVALPALVLAGCFAAREEDGFPESVPVDVAAIPDATPVAEPLSRYGNPDSYEVLGERYHVLKTSAGYREKGRASWYGTKFHGKRTSSGERYDMFAMTAAHRTLPLPTYVRVTHLGNGRSIVVRVNDRGPFHKDRIIDLSYAAAAKLDILEHGSAPVEVEAVGAAALDAEAPPYLQVGAFRDVALADSLRQRLAGMGFDDAAIRSERRDGIVWHRVLVGPFADATGARHAREALSARNLESHPVPD